MSREKVRARGDRRASRVAGGRAGARGNSGRVRRRANNSWLTRGWAPRAVLTRSPYRLRSPTSTSGSGLRVRTLMTTAFEVDMFAELVRGSGDRKVQVHRAVEGQGVRRRRDPDLRAEEILTGWLPPWPRESLRGLGEETVELACRHPCLSRRRRLLRGEEYRGQALARLRRGVDDLRPRQELQVVAHVLGDLLLLQPARVRSVPLGSRR